VDAKRFRQTLTAAMGDLTASAFAEHIGISESALSRWRSGQRLPGWRSLAALNRLYPEMPATAWGWDCLDCRVETAGCLRGGCEVTHVRDDLEASGTEEAGDAVDAPVPERVASALVVGSRVAADDAVLDDLVRTLLWGQQAIQSAIQKPVSTITLATALGVLGRNAVAVARLLAAKRRLEPGTAAEFEATILAALDELKRDGWQV